MSYDVSFDVRNKIGLVLHEVKQGERFGVLVGKVHEGGQAEGKVESGSFLLAMNGRPLAAFPSYAVFLQTLRSECSPSLTSTASSVKEKKKKVEEDDENKNNNGDGEGEGEGEATVAEIEAVEVVAEKEFEDKEVVSESGEDNRREVEEGNGKSNEVAEKSQGAVGEQEQEEEDDLVRILVLSFCAPTPGTSFGGMENASPKAALTKPRSDPFASMLSLDEIDSSALHGLAFRGIPDQHRSLFWKLLLGLLPLKRSDWPKALSDQRELYASYKKQFTKMPNAQGEEMSSRPVRLQGQAWWEFELPSEKEEASVEKQNEVSSSNISEEKKDIPRTPPSVDSSVILVESEAVEDDPLSTDPGSEWSSFFENSELREEIWKDVQRTNPGLHFFTHDTYVVMERILFLFAKLNPGIGYVQGMNEVLAPLYYVMKTNEAGEMFQGHAEADTFFCFTSMMGEIRDLFITGLDSTDGGLRGKISAMSDILKRHDPPLAAHFEALGVHFQFFSIRWLTTLMAREFTLPDTLRIWDSLLGDPKRFRYLLHFACAMIILCRTELLQGDFAFILQLLQNYPPSDVDAILRKANEINELETALENGEISSVSPLQPGASTRSFQIASMTKSFTYMKKFVATSNDYFAGFTGLMNNKQ